MARYHVEMLAAARLLVARGQRPRGRMPAALVRRSISTSYYALSHFLLDEASQRIVGTTADLLKRRRVTARAFTHTGMRQALERVQKAQVQPTLQAYLGVAVPPAFARSMAQTFSRAQDQRHEADYDLNAALSETDALILAAEIETAIADWLDARTDADRDFKSALCLLMLLKGELRGR